MIHPCLGDIDLSGAVTGRWGSSGFLKGRDGMGRWCKLDLWIGEVDFGC